jgi:sirohydrochlorin cobaltochelatase
VPHFHDCAGPVTLGDNGWMKTATIFFCHGARAATWRAPFDRFLDQCRVSAPHQHFALAFLELMEPGLPVVVNDLVSQGFMNLQVVPLFLAPGSHTQRDLPELLAQCRETHPGLTIEAGGTLLELPGLAQWLVERLVLKAPA